MSYLGRDTLSKRTHKKDPVEERRRELGVSLRKLFEMAAQWLYKNFGQKIRKGMVLEAITKYQRRGLVPDWVSRWLAQSRPAAA